MKLNRSTFVVGGACTPFIGKFHPDFIWKGHKDFGQRDNPTLEDYLKLVTASAAQATGVDMAQIDKAYVGNFVGELFSNQGHLGAALAGSHPGLQYKPIMRMEGACASGGLALVAAVDAIQAGYDLALVVGVEVQTTANAKVGADYLARASHYASQRSLDPMTFPALFARRAKVVREAFGITEEDIADLAVKAYSNANKNPLAHMRTVKMDREAALSSPLFLENPELNPFMRVSHCSQVSDGACAIIIASEAGLKKLGKARADVSELASYGHAAGSLYQVEDMLGLATTSVAARNAYQDAGISPTDVAVAEVHDCFAITEILMYEALGFAERGHGVDLVRNGATTLEGHLPVNTGGGLLAFGHPVGATGVKQILELHRQLKGQAGAYQVATRSGYGLAANMGGDDRTSVVTVLKA